MKTINFSASDEMIQKLDSLAKQKDMSRSRLIYDIIQKEIRKEEK